MKRRKKRREAAHLPGVDPLAHNGIYPYLVQFVSWSETKAYSPGTLKVRADGVRRFMTWCDERGLTRPQDITHPILERYRRYLFHYRKANGEPLSFASQQQLLLPLRAFFKWLTRENLILYNPASELELPRVHRRLPKQLLTAEEVERILNQTMLHGELGIRDRAIIETLYSTGVRRTELMNLKLYDVDTQNGTLMVCEGKGGKDRMVPLGARAGHWIGRYRDEVRPLLVMEPDAGYLFLHEFGEPFAKNRLSDLVKRYIAAAGVMKPGACHIFRHTMATLMLENGADIRFIQAILGHADLSSTQIYTQVSIRKLKEIHTRTHPAGLTVRAHDATTDSALHAEPLLATPDAEADSEDESASL